MRRGLALLVVAVALSGCAWTQYRGGAARTGTASWDNGVSLATLDALRPAWTSADHGALAEELVTRAGRVVVPGASALWALDLHTGADRWHVDRTLGHQVNHLSAASTWQAGATDVVAMSQDWSDSVSGTPYFQNIGRVTLLDLADGSVRSSEDRAGPTPPAATDAWAYFPQDHIVAVPPSIGPSEIDIRLVARPLGATGTPFTVALPGSVPIITDVAVDGGRLYVRDRFGLRVLSATGCGQPSCAPVWTSDYTNGSSLGRIAVAGGRVFDIDQNGALTVLPATCATASCAPLWTATVPGGRGLAVVRDRVFVTGGSTLSAFATGGCGAATCAPAWTSAVTGTLGDPTVVGDAVLAGSTNGDLLAWAIGGCGHATCVAKWSQAQGAAVGPVTPVDRGLFFVVGGAVRRLALPE